MAGDAGADSGVRPSLSSPIPPSLLPELALTVLASPSPCTALTSSVAPHRLTDPRRRGPRAACARRWSPSPSFDVARLEQECTYSERLSSARNSGARRERSREAVRDERRGRERRAERVARGFATERATRRSGTRGAIWRETVCEEIESTERENGGRGRRVGEVGLESRARMRSFKRCR